MPRHPQQARRETPLLGRALLLGSLLLAAAAAGAAAQERQEPQDPQQRDNLSAGIQALLNADLKIGPFFVKPEIGIRGAWESVPNAREEDGGLVTDLVARPTGQLQILLPFRERHEILVRGRAHYDWYRDLEGLRRFNTAAGGSYTYTSERLVFRVADDFVWGQQGAFNPLDVGQDLADVDTQLDVDEIVGLTSNSLSASIDWDVRPRLFLGLRARRSVTDFDDDATADGADLSRRLDRTATSFGSTIGWELRPSTRLSALYDRQTSDFDSPDNIRENDTDRIAGRLELEPNPRFSADLLAGVRRFRPVREDVQDFTGFSGLGSVRVVPGGRVEIELSAERDVQLSAFEENSHFVREGGRFETLFAIKREIRIGGDLSFHTHAYPEPVTLEEVGQVTTLERRDDMLRYGGRLEWGFGRAGRIVSRVGWFERDSNFDRFDLDGLTLQFGYSVAY